jgi:hypothetical protein
MKKNILFRFLSLTSTILPLHVSAAVGIANSVPPFTTQNIYIVPERTTVSLNSAVFSQGDCTQIGVFSVHHQRILKSGNPITADITIPPGGSFQLIFNPPIVFQARDIISVENGDFNCTSNFLLQGQ